MGRHRDESRKGSGKIGRHTGPIPVIPPETSESLTGSGVETGSGFYPAEPIEPMEINFREIRIGSEPTVTEPSEDLSDPSPRGSLAGLVQLDGGGVPVDPETGEPTAPSNPDLFGHDPFYDRDERPRFAAWALALVVVLVLVTVGGTSFMFGKGEITGTPVGSKEKIVTETATVTEQAPAVAGPTVYVTRKSQPAKPVPTPTVTVTKPGAPAPTIFRTGLPQFLPGPTIFRTQAAPTVTKTITNPGPTKTVYRDSPAQCYRVRQGVIVGEISCP